MESTFVVDGNPIVLPISKRQISGSYWLRANGQEWSSVYSSYTGRSKAQSVIEHAGSWRDQVELPNQKQMAGSGIRTGHFHLEGQGQLWFRFVRRLPDT